MAGPGKEATGTKDVDYNLVSIIYHALQGAETYAMYIGDAERAGDSELAEFFGQVQQEEQARSSRAKKLLADRLKG